MTVHCTLDLPSPARRRAVRGSIFELPAILPLVVEETRIVVVLVEVFEDGGEDLREFVRQGDAFGVRFQELAANDGGEEGGEGQNVFVGGEEAGFGADDYGDDGGGHGTGSFG